MANIQRQELWCHDCNKYVQFDLDLELNGNHVLNCPNCGHEHCRVVKDGIITDERWDQRNGNTYQVSTTNATITITSTYSAYQPAPGTQTSNGTSFVYYSWMNTMATS